jgi:hypothetical protein
VRQANANTAYRVMIMATMDGAKQASKNSRVIARHGIARTPVFVMTGIALVACGSDDSARLGEMASLIFTK